MYAFVFTTNTQTECKIFQVFDGLEVRSLLMLSVCIRMTRLPQLDASENDGIRLFEKLKGVQNPDNDVPAIFEGIEGP